jgi:tol-pal system protein YbgF
MRQRILGVFLAAAIVATAAPASAANKEHQQLMADLRMLQEQSQLLQNLIGALNESIKAVNARLDDQANVNRKAFADQKLIIDTLSGDARVIREKLDDNNVRLGSLAQEVDSMRQALQQLNGRPSTTESDPAAGSSATGGSPSPGSSSGTPIVTVSPQKMQDAAQADYAAGQYDLAIEGFQAYIRNFPKSDWTDDAQVYICRSYINDGKYDKAVEACDTAIRNYPGGNAIPDAYYQKGLALRALKDLNGARTTWETLIRNYKDSDASRMAQQALEGLKRPN